jgi:hypothetical protein
MAQHFLALVRLKGGDIQSKGKLTQLKCPTGYPFSSIFLPRVAARHVVNTCAIRSVIIQLV